jgi:adenylosuccinate synthase
VKGSIKVVIGTQWGDEAKGKISDFIKEELGGKVDAFARFQGGNNAGHTIVFGGTKYKLNYLPAGAASGHKAILGHDMVIHVPYLKKEIESLKDTPWDPKTQLFISDKAHVTIDQQIVMDGVLRKLQGKFSAESTLRGIAPTYAYKMFRSGIRFVDLLDYELLKQRLTILFNEMRPIFEKISEQDMAGVGESLEKWYGDFGRQVFENGKTLDAEAVAQRYYEFGLQLKNNIQDINLVIRDLYDAGGTIIAEGAQGIMLDITQGAYPYTTSSNIGPGAACTGLGITPKMIDEVIGVVKVMGSRVGAGPLPTELIADKDLDITQQTQDKIAKETNEFGTTTGRMRRIMWPDAVCLKHAARICGFDRIALTKLDMIPIVTNNTNTKHAKIGVKYTTSAGKVHERAPPSNWNKVEGCKVEYESFPIWKNLDSKEWLELSDKGELPKEMLDYAKRIAEIMGVKDMILSFGPEREATRSYSI